MSIAEIYYDNKLKGNVYKQPSLMVAKQMHKYVTEIEAAILTWSYVGKIPCKY